MAEISIVVPARNEAGNMPALLDGILLACDTGLEVRRFEVIVIDDASADSTGTSCAKHRGRSSHPAVDKPQETPARVRLSTPAYWPRTANGSRRWMVTGKTPPAELPRLLGPLLDPGCDAELGLVAGQRVKRRDSWSKRAASRFANGVRSFVLKDATRDTGCGLKAFRRDAFLRLPYFDHMHRYLPALFARDGWKVAHIDVAHQPRVAGSSNYSNLQRGLVGLVDLFGVFWLIRRKKKSRAVEVGTANLTPPKAKES